MFPLLKLFTHRLDICSANAILDICTAESCVSVSCGDFLLTRNSMTAHCRNDTELRLFPSRLVFLLLINYLFYFPFSFSHFVHISIFLSRSQNLLLQSSTDEYTSPSLLQPASTLLAGITLLRTYHRPHVPYINCIPDLPSFFGFLTLEDGTDRLFRNVAKELPLLAR